jgi:hypothetical protein
MTTSRTFIAQLHFSAGIIVDWTLKNSAAQWNRLKNGTNIASGHGCNIEPATAERSRGCKANYEQIAVNEIITSSSYQQQIVTIRRNHTQPSEMTTWRRDSITREATRKLMLSSSWLHVAGS